MALPSFLYSLWSEHFILWKQHYSIHLSAVHTYITSQIVLLSPGRRLELLQVLRTEAVVAWQVYESPGAALQTGWRKTKV